MLCQEEASSQDSPSVLSTVQSEQDVKYKQWNLSKCIFVYLSYQGIRIAGHTEHHTFPHNIIITT